MRWKHPSPESVREARRKTHNPSLHAIFALRSHCAEESFSPGVSISMLEINGNFISSEILPSKFDISACYIWWLCRRIAETFAVCYYKHLPLYILSTLIGWKRSKEGPFDITKQKSSIPLKKWPFGLSEMLKIPTVRCIGSFTLPKLVDEEWFSASN